MIDIIMENKAVVSTAAFVFGFVIFSLLEASWPRRVQSDQSGWRWLNNLGLAATTISIGRLAATSITLAVAWWVERDGIGLMQHFNSGIVTQIIVGIFVLDLALYLIHRLMHASPLLWRLHAVHHSDTDIDLSTSLRNHPLNTFVVLGLRLPIILLVGLSPIAVALYELIARIVDMGSHTNVKVSSRIDTALRKLVVTPDYHRNHHMSEKRLTNSNYATVFPIWDHLFGTASDIPYDAHEDAEIGLEYFRERRDTRLDQLLIMPFRHMGPPAEDQVSASPVTGSSP